MAAAEAMSRSARSEELQSVMEQDAFVHKRFTASPLGSVARCLGAENADIGQFQCSVARSASTCGGDTSISAPHEKESTTPFD
jgi:hypothetical protein